MLIYLMNKSNKSNGSRSSTHFLWKRSSGRTSLSPDASVTSPTEHKWWTVKWCPGLWRREWPAILEKGSGANRSCHARESSDTAGPAPWSGRLDWKKDTVMFEGSLFIILMVCNFPWLMIHLQETVLCVINGIYLQAWVVLFLSFFCAFILLRLLYDSLAWSTLENQHCLINPLYRAKRLHYARYRMADV